MENSLLVIVIALLLAVWNGQVNNWRSIRFQDKAKWSRRWHRTGFLIRGALLLIVWLNSGLGLAGIALFAMWPVYNIIIALYMGQKWYYIGETAWIDRTIPHMLHYAMYLMVLIGSIVLTLKGV